MERGLMRRHFRLRRSCVDMAPLGCAGGNLAEKSRRGVERRRVRNSGICRMANISSEN